MKKMMQPILAPLALCLAVITAPACVGEDSFEDARWRSEDLTNIEGGGDIDCPDCYWDLNGGEVAISVLQRIEGYSIEGDQYEIGFRLIKSDAEISIPIFMDKDHCFGERCEAWLELTQGSIQFPGTKPISLGTVDDTVILALVEEIEEYDDVGLESPRLGVRFRLQRKNDL